MMRRSLMIIPTMLLCSMWTVGCDTTDELHRPKTEQRTMIIGGVPANDLDYKMPHEDVALNEAATNDD